MTRLKQELNDPFRGTFWVNKGAEIRWRIALDEMLVVPLCFSVLNDGSSLSWLTATMCSCLLTAWRFTHPWQPQVLRPPTRSYTTLFFPNLLFRFPDLSDLSRVYFYLSFSFLLSRRKRWRLRCLRSSWRSSVELMSLRPLFPEFI